MRVASAEIKDMDKRTKNFGLPNAESDKRAASAKVGDMDKGHKFLS